MLDGIGPGRKTMHKLNLLSGAQRTVTSPQAPSSLFDSANLTRGYFPSNTFFYSFLCHLIGISAMLVGSIYRSIPDPPSVVDHINYIDLRLPKIVFLPTMIAPGNQGMRIPTHKKKARAKKPSELQASSAKGLSYPGPQTIISDPPNPTNSIQTVLQPDIENPPVLIPPIPLPNIVQVAEVALVAPKIPEPPPEPPKEVKPPEEPKPEPVPETPPQPKAPEPAMVLPELKLAPQMRMEKPKLILPPSIPPLIEAKPSERPEKIELPSLIKAPALPPPPEPSPEPAAKPAEPPQKSPETAMTETAPKTSEKPKELSAAEPSSAAEGARNLLSLTPMPASTKEPVKVPSGEARGRFAISPEPNLAVSEKAPGSKTGIRSEDVGIGNIKPAPTGNEAASAKGPAVSAGGETEAARGKSATAGDQRSNTGRGSSAGSGSGSGTGKGSAKKPFSGITIMGGSFDSGENSDYAPVTPARKPLQTSYGLNIISTENSGGGLPFFGVFSHEQIYTVYLDMRQVEADQDPSWTLEFAVISGSASQAGSTRSQQGLILPFPAEKEQPVFPADVVRKSLNKMIIVYGVVNIEGKLEQVSIKDSPDALLNEPVLRSLSKWIFRPAQLNGEPVAAKLLMGIPLWLPQ
jgi:hypothetical protein